LARINVSVVTPACSAKLASVSPRRTVYMIQPGGLVQVGSGVGGWVGVIVTLAGVAVSPSGIAVTVVSCSDTAVGPVSVPVVVGEGWGVKVGKKGVSVERRAIP
jgi:hypothetical protein